MAIFGLSVFLAIFFVFLCLCFYIRFLFLVNPLWSRRGEAISDCIQPFLAGFSNPSLGFGDEQVAVFLCFSARGSKSPLGTLTLTRPWFFVTVNYWLLI